MEATIDGDWLTLPVGALFLGSKKLRHVLYVRKAYVLLKAALKELKEIKGVGHVVVSGNPGVGKSRFAIYMLIEWLQEGLAVIWHSHKIIYLFDGGKVSILSPEDAALMLISGEDRRLRYIADGTAPLLPAVEVEQSLVAHSPDERHYKEYMKPDGHLAWPLYMPLWELYELEAMRLKLYPSLSHEKMMQLVGKRGAVPRTVLEKADQSAPDRSITAAIQGLKYDDLFAIDPGSLHTSHRIAHVHPPLWEIGNFEDFELKFLSTEIQERVTQRAIELLANDVSRLMQLTDKSAAGLAKDMGACLFESLTHPKLKAGGVWQKSILQDLCPLPYTKGPVRKLAAAGEEHSKVGQLDSDTFKLPPLPVMYFQQAEDLRGVPAGDIYLQPPVGFEAIDSIAVVGGKAYLLQITQDVTHGIKNGLLKVLEFLPKELEVEFVWVLPQGVWSSKTFNVKELPKSPSPGTLPAETQQLVEKRLRACQQQYKIPVQVGIEFPPKKSRLSKSKNAPSSQLSATSRMGQDTNRMLSVATKPCMPVLRVVQKMPERLRSKTTLPPFRLALPPAYLRLQ